MIQRFSNRNATFHKAATEDVSNWIDKAMRLSKLTAIHEMLPTSRSLIGAIQAE